MTPWKLETDFENHRHLFTDTDCMDYIVVTYVCECSNTDVIVKNKKQSLVYVCPACNNQKFHNANRALTNIENFIDEDNDVHLEGAYALSLKDKRIISKYSVSILSDVDFLTKQVTYSTKNLYTLELNNNGTMDEQYPLAKDEVIIDAVVDNLNDYINSNSFDIPKPDNIKIHFGIASFFLKHKYLKEFEFYYWANLTSLGTQDTYISEALEKVANYRLEKSLKKALYTNYMKQIKENRKFHSFLIEAFIKNIEDVNIVVNFLKLEVDYSLPFNNESMELFFNILTTYYSSKQILNLFVRKDFNQNLQLFRDTLSMLSFDEELVQEVFQKVPCKIGKLHDEITRCTQIQHHKHICMQSLDYIEEKIKPCVEIDRYEVKLPMNGEDLHTWSNALQNCMFSYFDEIQHSQTIIYGFFENNVLVFAVEILNNRIVQASQKFNQKLEDNQKEALNKWLRLFSIKARVDKI